MLDYWLFLLFLMDHPDYISDISHMKENIDLQGHVPES